MASAYFETLRDYFTRTIINKNGQIVIQHESVKKLCETLTNDFCLIDPYQKAINNARDQEKFCREFNWFYNQLMYISINNSHDSTDLNIKKVINLMIEKTLKICPNWFQQLLALQIKVLEMFDLFHIFDNNHPIQIEFAGSDNSPDLPFTPIQANNKDELEIIACFVLDTLYFELQLFRSNVIECGIPFAPQIMSAFKYLGITGKVSALRLLADYFEAVQCDDSIEIVTNVMQVLARFYQNLHTLIEEVPSDREFYTLRFAPTLVQFCNAIMTCRDNHLQINTSTDQKNFTNAFLDAIFHEFLFAKVQCRTASIITKLVSTFDYVMYRANFTKEAIEDGIKTFMLNIGYDISEVFCLLKYIIIIELENAKMTDNYCKVTSISESWKTIYKKLVVKSNQTLSCKYEFFSLIEWIANTLSVAVQTYDLFTHRLQVFHLDKINNSNYKHITLDFFVDIQDLASGIIDRVKEATIIDESFEVLTELFISLLQLSIDTTGTKLTEEQKVFVLSVIFLPFYPMMRANAMISRSTSFMTVEKHLPAHLSKFIYNHSSEQLASMKAKTINKITYLKLSNVGEIGTWFGTSLTRLMLKFESNQFIVRKFTEKFKDILISNANVMYKYIQAYQESAKSYIELKWILCLQDKNFIAIKRTSPPNFSKTLGYDIICKSCKEQALKTDKERIAECMERSKGYIVSISDINVREKLSMNLINIFNSPEIHRHFVIKAIKPSIVHDKSFYKMFEADGGRTLLDTILINEEDMLFHLEKSFDSIIKSIIKSQELKEDFKIQFFKLLFDRITERTHEASRHSYSLQIQKYYASMVAIIGCNAKQIPQESKLLFKNETFAIKCFLTLGVFTLGKETQLRGIAVELAINILRANDMEFSQAIHWHQSIVESVCHLCLMESIHTELPFLNVLYDHLLAFGFNDFDSFLKKNINLVLATIYPFCLENRRLEIIRKILDFLDVSFSAVIAKDPIIVYKMIFEAPENKRSKLKNSIQNEGNFEFSTLFRQERTLVIQHAAVYHANHENLFNEVLRQILKTNSDCEEEMLDYGAMTKTVADLFLGIMVHMDSVLSNELVYRKMKEMALKSIGTLLRFIGSSHATDLCFKVMGLLKSTAKLPSNLAFKSVYLSSWKILIRTCNPETLGPFLSQIIVALEPYIEEFPDEVEDICDYFISQNQSVLGKYLVDFFYIDKTKYSNLVKIRSRINSQCLTNGSDFEVNLRRLISYMRSDSADSDVKNYCLEYLQEFSKANRSKILELIFMPRKNEVTISEVLGILLNCCRNKSSDALLVQTAVCFGEIGALKPDFHFEKESKSNVVGFTIHSDEFALYTLNLLCKDYKDLHQSDHMEFIAVGIQGVISERNMTKTNGLYKKLSTANQNLIKPFFKSRYIRRSAPISHKDIVFWHRAQTPNAWAELFATMLIDKIEPLKTYELLSSLNCSMKFNDEIASFLLPYVFLHYFQTNPLKTNIIDAIVREFKFVFEVIRDERALKRLNLQEFHYKYLGGPHFNAQKPDINQSKAVQYANEFVNAAKQIAKLIFEVMDFLNRFQFRSREENKYIKEMLKNFDSKTLAQVSYNCGDYQRALVHFESYLTTLDDDDVKKEDEWPFLVHIYAKLGDNDSILGVADKRKHPWSATDKMFIGNITGKWDDHTVCIEEIIRTPKNISVEVIASTVNCLVAYNSCEQAVVVADKMLAILHKSCKNDLICFDEVKIEALLRLSRFDELEKVVKNNSNVLDISNWRSVEAKLLLHLRSDIIDTIEEWNIQINTIRRKLMENFKIFETNQSIYKINYESIIRLHMLTDIDKAYCVLQGIKENVNDGKKIVKSFSEEIRERKKLIKLTSTQSECLLALHRTLFKEIRHTADIKMRPEDANDIFKLVQSEIGQNWLDCAIVYQNQHDQASAFLIEAEKYKPPGLFIQKAKLIWRKYKNPVQATKILQFHCDQIEKTPNFRDNPFYANGLLLIARYNGEAAAVDYCTNKSMYKKALTANVDCDKAYLHYAEYLDRTVLLRGDKEPDVNTIDTLLVKEILEAYGKGLLYSTEYVFQALPRFLQIWFDATVQQKDAMKRKSTGVSAHNAQLNSIARKFANSLKPFQFYTAFSQLISRICHPCPEVYEILKEIISKLFEKYPRHSLWYVVHAMKSKTKLAADRMHEIFRTVPRNKMLVSDFEHFIDRMLEISRIQKPEEIGAQPRKVNAILGKIKSRLLMPLQHNLQILDETIMNNLTEDDQIFIYKMNDEITILRSMQKPKKVSFTGSNGKIYHLMVKSKEDLRIDFRFMEFCKVLNDYFRKDREASQRFFSIRTYSVSPINEEVGIIEWLQNVETLKNVIFSQYHASKITIPSQRELRDLDKAWSDTAIKTKLLDTMKKHFPPVLGRWYQVTFSCSQSYFSARHQYIKSTAIMSVVGYLFGLGDRHLENILVDQETGEIAHVDFNSMFNASEKLRIPETVPFRLTPSLIEAMGVLGTEGSFRKFCEFTMRLLQHRKNVLISYLRPFVFDPLIQNFSPSDSEQTNGNSSAAIKNIVRKLKGIPRKYRTFLEIPLSPEGHVKFIIDEAKSAANLSVMYFPWSPFI